MYDILTVCAGQDLRNVSLCAQGLRENLDFGTLFIVTNEPELVSLTGDGIVVIDENEIIGHDVVKKLKSLKVPFFPSRFGWYYQQFLKMGFARSKYCCGDYLIWDADTILLEPLEFSSEKGVFYTKGGERLNKNYVNTYKKILPFDFNMNVSMISQHLFVKKYVMIKMLDEIEAHTSEDYYYGILNNLQGNSPSLFSEYETYINYHLAIEPSKVEIRTVNWFRHAAAICGFSPKYSTLKRVFKNTKYVALEKFDLTTKGRLKSHARFVVYKFKSLVSQVLGKL